VRRIRARRISDEAPAGQIMKAVLTLGFASGAVKREIAWLCGNCGGGHKQMTRGYLDAHFPQPCNRCGEMNY
jgi:hypothetical protein